MTPTEKQDLWNAILKLNNKPYIGSGYGAYNNVKNPALRGGLYTWKYRDMRDLYEQLVKYCELGESEACWRVLLGYKTKIYPAYLRKIYQTLNCGSIPTTCPAVGDYWHGGYVFAIDGNDYYVVSDIDFDNTPLWTMCNSFGFNQGTQSGLIESYNNTVLLGGSPCGYALASEVLLPITENGYSDWFIPSSEAFDAIVSALGNTFLSRGVQYWSSTENGTDNMIISDSDATKTDWLKSDLGPWTRLIRKETCI